VTITEVAAAVLKRLRYPDADFDLQALVRGEASSLWLTRRGDVLYGVTPGRLSGYMVQISVEKESGALASPASEQSSRP